MDFIQQQTTSIKFPYLLFFCFIWLSFLTGCAQESEARAKDTDIPVVLSVDTDSSAKSLSSIDTTVVLSGDTDSSTLPLSSIDTRASVSLPSDFTINVGESILLEPSINNLDPSIVTYRWVQTSGTQISLTEDDKPYIAFTASENDVFEFEMTVTDDQGVEYTDSITITVLPVDENTQNTARISWTAPTLNEDGSSLTNLSGYKIYYGESEANLDKVITVNAQQTSYDIDNLESDHSYFFCIKAYNNLSLESQCSETVEINFW